MGKPKTIVQKHAYWLTGLTWQKKSLFIGGATNNCQTAAASCIWQSTHELQYLVKSQEEAVLCQVEMQDLLSK